MGSFKNYSLAGAGPSLQLGKKGGLMKYLQSYDDGNGGTAPAFQLHDATDTTLIRIQVGTPTHWYDATTKKYVDSLVQGLDVKGAVTVASYTTPGQSGSGNVAMTGALLGFIVDGIQMNIGNRILLKDQTNTKYNGIWVVTDAGSGNYQLVRSEDANNKTQDAVITAGSEVRGGMFCFVESGTQNADTGWVLSTPTGSVSITTTGSNGDNITFTQFSQAGVIQAGICLKKTGLTMDVQVDNVTIYKTTSNTLGVKSNGVLGNLLIATNNPNATATWGSLDLSNANTVGSSILAAPNGGTGLSSYNAGDMLYANTTSTLNTIAKGANNQVLGISSSGVISYRYLNEIRDNNNVLVAKFNPSTYPINYLTFTSSNDSSNVLIGADGFNDNIGITISPKGVGGASMKSGYDTWLTSNELSLSNEIIATKGFVAAKVAAINTSRIQNPATTSAFDTNLSGFANTPVAISRNMVVASFDGNTSLTNGEYTRFYAQPGEVQIYARNSSQTGDVDMRFVPQNNGQIYIGAQGAGLIEGEAGYALTVKGGDSSSSYDGGDTIIRAGDGTTLDFNGGSVYLRPGNKSGNGTQGMVTIEDAAQGIVAQFKGPSSGSTNNLQFIGSIPDLDPLVAGVQIKAIGAGSDVSIIMNPKGTNGLVRVLNATTYLAALKQNGLPEAIVTKGYVQYLVGGQTKIAGAGLTDDSNVFNVNVAANTIGIDGSNNMIVTDNNVAGANRVLLSNAQPGVESSWGALPLSSSASVTGVLGTSNGGTGQNTYSQYDLLIGTSGASLTRLTVGPNNSVLSVNSSGVLGYNYFNSLRDANGRLVIQGTGVSNAVNWLTVQNAALGGAITVGTAGTNQDVDLILNPSGNGVIWAKTGYTALIPSSREVIVTKGYVDDALLYNTDPLLRRAQLNSSWTTTMNVGTPTPNVSGRAVYVTKVTFVVNTPMTTTGSPGTVLARVVVGSTEIMAMGENDPDLVGTYVSDLNFSFPSSNQQIAVQFYKSDGVTAATPNGGDITITVEYRIS